MNSPSIDNESVERIKDEIRERMGVCPSLFLLVVDSPPIMENLWQQALVGYLDNPLPSLFKEKLFAYLSRFCNVPYCMARHCGFLLGNGHVAGDAACKPLAPDEVLQLIRQPAPTAEQLGQCFAMLAATSSPLDALPEPGCQLETALLVCCVPVFRQRGNVEQCQAELRRVLGATRYDQLVALLAFIRTAHYWTETHPDIEFENDLQHLFAEQQSLAEWIKSYPAAVHEELQQVDDELAELRSLRSELELRVLERTAELRLAQTAARMGIWEWDVKRDRVTWDANQFELFGLDPTNAITSETFYNHVHPDDLPEQKRVAQDVLENGAKYDTEFRIIRPDGETRWIAARGDVIREESNKPLRFIGVNFDITARKHSERELARLAAIVESSNDAIIGKDLDGTIQSWNDAAEQLYGYSPDEVVGKPIDIIVPPDRQHEIATIRERVRRGERVDHFETVRLCKNGQAIDVSLAVSPIEDGAGLIVGAATIARDITDRKRAEVALQENERMFRALFEQAGGYCMLLRPTDNGIPEILDVNEAACNAHGYTRNEMIGRPGADLDDEEGKRLCRERTNIIMSGKTLMVQTNHVRKDGSVFPVEVFAKKVEIAGKPPIIMTTEHDITERKQAEQALRDREERLSAIFDTAVDAIITIDERGTVESLNQAACQLFGFAADEVIGENVKLLMPQPFRGEHDQYLRNYLESGQAKIIGIGREVVGQRKNGSTFPMHLAVSEVGLSERRLFTGIVRDLSELKDAQKKLVQSERLAAMGEMMSSIAHESRNALQRIQAGVDMLQLDIPEDSEAASDLAQIAIARNDLQTLLEELRDFAAPAVLDLQKCNLATVWQQAWRNVSVHAKSHQAELVEQTEGAELECAVDSFRVEQIFRNLFENSLAACSDTVKIQIACTDCKLESVPAVRISVRDNGPGLTQEQQDRMFEAFFTTKPKGTGLGMAIAMKTIQAHHGTLAASNGENGGAEFTITLPRRQK